MNSDDLDRLLTHAEQTMVSLERLQRIHANHAIFADALTLLTILAAVITPTPQWYWFVFKALVVLRVFHIGVTLNNNTKKFIEREVATLRFYHEVLAGVDLSKETALRRAYFQIRMARVGASNKT